VDPLVLDFEQFIQIVDKLIEDLWVLFCLDARADRVHLFSFLSGHRSASKEQQGEQSTIVPTAPNIRRMAYNS
jgi:hypothetical protein